MIIATSDFQHAHARRRGDDARAATPTSRSRSPTRWPTRKAIRAAVKDSGRIVQIGTQRRSSEKYQRAYDFIKSGQFGDIVMAEMTWNVNQPGRWRRPKLVAELREQDTDWKRFLINRPQVPFDARKHLEYRLFWPYSSGIPDQWMVHQIDTVHWFTDLPRPRRSSPTAASICWKDGRQNYDTMTAVFDYGPLNDSAKGFQVLYSSRMTNQAGDVKELYFSNGGTMNLDTGEITPEGGLQERTRRRWEWRRTCSRRQSLTDERREDGHGRVDRCRQRHQRQRPQLDGVRAQPQDAERRHRGRLSPLGRALHDHRGPAHRPARHFDDRRQEVVVNGDVTDAAQL